MNRFVERLRTGPPVVADGGMGALISAAVPRLRCPEEANLRSPESVVSVHVGYIRAGAELIETNTFGANRPKLAAHFLEEDFEKINSTAVRLAREARDVSGGEIFIAGSIGPLGDVELRPQSARGALRGAGGDPGRPRRRPDHARDVLRPGRARDGDRRGEGRVVAADRRADDVRRGRTDARRRVREAGGRASRGSSTSRRSARTTAPAPRAALSALAEMERDGLVLAALPNVGLASLAGARVVYPHATPEYFAEFAAQARQLGAGVIGGCCGTTPAQISAIRDGGGREPAAVRTAGRGRAAPDDRARRGDVRDRARAALPRERVRRLDPDRPAARRRQPRAAGGRARDPRVGEGAPRRRQRQPSRTRAHERSDGVGRDRALRRDRDDPAPDAARLHGHGPRVAAARRARGRRPQHPRGHRRPARGSGLPRRGARRLRGRRDRAHRVDRAPQPRRGLPRPRRSTRRRRSTSASRSTRPPTTSTSSWSASSASSTQARSSR